MYVSPLGIRVLSKHYYNTNLKEVVERFDRNEKKNQTESECEYDRKKKQP